MLLPYFPHDSSTAPVCLMPLAATVQSTAAHHPLRGSQDKCEALTTTVCYSNKTEGQTFLLPETMFIFIHFSNFGPERKEIEKK